VLFVCKFVKFFFILKTFLATNTVDNIGRKYEMRIEIKKLIKILLENLIEFFYFIRLNITQVKKYLKCRGFNKYFVCTIIFVQLPFRKLATYKFYLNKVY